MLVPSTFSGLTLTLRCLTLILAVILVKHVESCHRENVTVVLVFPKESEELNRERRLMDGTMSCKY